MTGPEPLVVIVCLAGIVATLWRCRRARHTPTGLPPIDMERYR